MTTLFISDLHLDDKRPETTALLLRFLEREAANAEALYILGDLFEYWLGDDAPSDCSLAVAKGLRALGQKGVACYFQHGNRDFLLRQNYADLAGMTLLPEEYLADLYGERVLLMHGDSLCTDDVEYQQFRSQVRDPAWQKEFLAQSAEQRLEAARMARDASALHKGDVAMAIMDVNAAEVLRRFERHGVQRLIHGHTHRPAVHELTANGQAAQRIVLGDWFTHGSVLRVTPDGYDLAVI
ncbi:MAG: UDP-2,3-diacylglucosamine diphosphatase [Xanthomonadales bacterium]|nr:UDP-2,3-diacylglucosamine diphosphatase [Xanthomonadales bacterium]